MPEVTQEQLDATAEEIKTLTGQMEALSTEKSKVDESLATKSLEVETMSTELGSFKVVAAEATTKVTTLEQQIEAAKVDAEKLATTEASLTLAQTKLQTIETERKTEIVGRLVSAGLKEVDLADKPMDILKAMEFATSNTGAPKGTLKNGGGILGSGGGGDGGETLKTALDLAGERMRTLRENSVKRFSSSRDTGE